MGIFSKVEKLQPDPIFELMKAYKQDPRKDKIDLGVGIYYNASLEPEILKSVKMTEKTLTDVEFSKAYLPIDGDSFFIEATKKLVLGASIVKEKGDFLYGAQSLGGTGALRVAADVLHAISKQAYISDPTWVNHKGIFKEAGFEIKSYPYYDWVSHQVTFDHMLKALEHAQERSVVVLHACCHNPTGKDLSQDQWIELSNLMLKKKLIPVFDVAYQGFGDSLEEDAWAVRHFAKSGHEMFICVSFSKIFGLYAERVGAVLFIGEDFKATEVVASHAKKGIRASYSNPSKHGASIVSYILNHEALKKTWEEELKAMCTRIHFMRSELTTALCSQSKVFSYDFLGSCKGLFAYTGLSDSVVDELREKYAIYMPSQGRINVTALNDNNLEVVVSAILKVSESS